MVTKAHPRGAHAKKAPARPPAKRRAKAPALPAAKKRKTRTSRPAPPAPGSPPSPSRSSGGAGIEWAPGQGEVGIRVRMYRVGFGDFFLVTFLNDGQPVHVIVDCGVFKGTSQTGDIGSIEAAVANMLETTGGQVALIIMTHRHADHIAGFARCSDTFKKLTVGGVWMPIWESEYDPSAMKFQVALTRTALSLRQHITALGANASDEQNTARKYMENATGELGVVGAVAAGSNAVALDLLKHGFAGVTPDYYKGGDNARLPQALVDAGLSAQILGPPPVTDMDLMKLMDLQKNVGQYLTDEGGEDTGLFEPFGSEWVVDLASAPKQGQSECYTPESFREWVQDPRKSWESVTKEEGLAARRKMQSVLQGEVQQLQPLAALTAAKQLNSFLNNQSLVVLFTFKRKQLLFVGDAQAGNWEHWLFDTDAPDKKASGTMGPAARQILTSLDFYKVGHHGSGNATPKAAAEMMGTREQKFAAMCSTEAGVYGTENPDDPTMGTEVPRGPLLEKLASEGALVRSDQIAISVDGKQIPAQAPAALPAPLPGSRFQQGSLWVDCYL
jgi:beta-lactamase superfamily II metal-dependent hydrolase